MNLIPAGKYEAVAVPVEVEGFRTYVQFGETKTGKIQVVVRCRLMTGASSGSELNWVGFFTDSAKKRTIESLRAFGFTGDDVSLAPEQELTRRVEAVVEHEDYEGRTYARIRWINQPGAIKPVDKSKLKALAMELKSTAESIGSTAGATPPPDDMPPF